MADPEISFPSNPPYYDVTPRRVWPVATYALLTINFLFFALEIHLGGFSNLQVLRDLGAAYGPYLRRGEYWRLVMPLLLHGGWMHILGNSYVLYILGPILERVYGYGRYLAIYVISGMGGAYLSMTLSKYLSVGASGAIMGVAGAILITGLIHRDVIPRRWGRAFGRGIIPFILFVLLSGLTSHGTDNWGHVGGLATGALLALLIPPPRPDASYGQYGEIAESPSQALAVIPIALVVASIVATGTHYRAVQNMNGLLAEGDRLDATADYQRELEDLRKAILVAPREESPHEKLGGYYLRQKQYDQAVREFQDAVHLTEGDNEARLDLALAYKLNGQPDKAQKLFDAVLGKNPRSDDEQREAANNQRVLGDLYAGLKLYPDAIQSYQQALQLAPDLAEAHNNLAWLYATCDEPQYRDPKGALTHAEMAVRLTGWKEGDFIDTLAEAHYVNGDYEQAVEIQKRALALDPDNPELKEHMDRYRRAIGTIRT